MEDNGKHENELHFQLRENCQKGDEHDLDIFLKENLAMDLNVLIEGNSALHIACLLQSPNVNTVKLLLACPDLDLNLRNSAGSTALHLAQNADSLAVAKLLLADPRCDAKARNQEGNTALWRAVYFNQLAIVKWMLFLCGRNMGLDLPGVLNGEELTCLQVATRVHPNTELLAFIQQLTSGFGAAQEDNRIELFIPGT